MTREEIHGRVIAGEARFDGAGAVVNLPTSNPTWTSAASAAAWQALFAKPTEGAKYVTGAHLRVTGGTVNASLAGAAPSAADGLEWGAGYERELIVAPEALRAAKFFVPVGAKLHVVLYWGRYA